MDAYQPTDAMRAEALETRRIEGYADGRSDEREQWLGLAGELRARILRRHQVNGSLTLSLEDVLAISAALRKAEGDGA